MRDIELLKTTSFYSTVALHNFGMDFWTCQGCKLAMMF
jgi:hypothetical protein